MRSVLAVLAMLRNKSLSMAVLLLMLLQACSADDQMARIEMLFPQKAGKSFHFVPKPAGELLSSSGFQDQKVLEEPFLTMLDLEQQAEKPRAAFRFELAKNQWAIVIDVPPGEASDHWGARLLVYDGKTKEYAPWQNLAERHDECTVSIVEAWLDFGGKENAARLTRRQMTFAFPDPELGNCDQVLPPEFVNEQFEWKEGGWKAIAFEGLASFKMQDEEMVNKRLAGYLPK
jgi:hypothetical protein